LTIISVPSPNFKPGRNNYKPFAIVIHIMAGSLDGTDTWFSNPVSQVSAHYGVGKNGELHQYVNETDTAWHAGRVNAPTWKLIQVAEDKRYINPNYYTVGIEHEGFENTDWTPETYQTSSQVIAQIANNWNIPLDRDHVIGHHEIYSLKTCPGSQVDLDKLIQMASAIISAGTAANTNTPATTTDPATNSNTPAVTTDPAANSNTPATITDPFSGANIPAIIPDPATITDPFTGANVPAPIPDPATATNTPATLPNPVYNIYTKVVKSGKATTLGWVNIRNGPNNTLVVVAIAPPNIQLAFDGYIDNGQTINGNARWYYTDEGNWFWSGGVK
jgi:N-acetylmuramoyl-L-alanine amidase